MSSMALEELSFKSVNGRMDDTQKVITISYFGLPLTKQHLNQISHTASVLLKELSFKTFLFFKIECCHGNQTKWPLVIKHIKWVDNHQMIITAEYSLHHFSGYGENAI